MQEKDFAPLIRYKVLFDEKKRKMQTDNFGTQFGVGSKTVATNSNAVQEMVEELKVLDDTFTFKAIDGTLSQGVSAHTDCLDTYSNGARLSAKVRVLVEKSISELKIVDEAITKMDFRLLDGGTMVEGIE